jgi:ribonuclease BN (tRNA processing enzyme)
LWVVVDGEDHWLAHDFPGFMLIVVDPIATVFSTTDACFATLRTYPEEDRKVTDGARIVVLGSRGSIPVSGAEFVRYGGNTTSVALTNGNHVVGFVDAGTGLAAHAAFGLELAPTVEVFLTHYHWDHIQGLSMLEALWSGDTDIVIHGHGAVERSLISVITPPWFPVSLADAPNVRFQTIGRPVEIQEFVVTPFEVEHPQGAVGYRVDGPSASVAFVTDHEAGTERDVSITTAIRGVDVLVHDAQYAPDEVEIRRGWGHSTWEGAVAAAEAAGTGQLLLTSLDPRTTDDDADAMLALTRQQFPNTEIAAQGLVVPL